MNIQVFDRGTKEQKATRKNTHKLYTGL